ncbi:MAG: fibronectin type III domain-containing protein [Firmicutes bacterium]|nr:fibronectin type III domain-containing protein [Bacillota bacterium]
MTKRLSETRKKLSVLVLALALIFTAVPATAHADDIYDDDYIVSNVSSLAAPTGLATVTRDNDEIHLKWNPVSGASGYEVWRYSSTYSKWILVERENENNAEIDDLLSATIYKFRVRAFAVKSDGSVVYGDYSSSFRTVTEPNDVNNLKATSKTKSTITLSWSPAKRADKYQVYQYDKASGTWDRLITTSKTTYKVTGLDDGISYKLRVRPYREALGYKYYGDWETITVKTTTSGSSSSSGAVTLAKAKSIALNYAGVSSSAANFIKAETDYNDGVKVYEIEFVAGDYEYEFEIGAASGKVRDYDKDYRWDD